MAVRLRLTRRGKKKQPTYRVVAADSRSPRDGRFIEIIGFYDPRQEPSEIRIDNEKAVKWLKVGAQPSERVRKLLDVSGAWAEFKGEPLPATATKAASAAKAATAEAPKVVTKARGEEGEAEAEATEEAAEEAAEKEAAKDEAEAETELAEVAAEEAKSDADMEEAEDGQAEASEEEIAEKIEEDK